MKTYQKSSKTLLLSLVLLLAATGLLQANTSLPLTNPLPEVAGPTGLVRADQATAGKVGALNTLWVGNEQVATPVRTQSGYLKVILWKIQSNGDLVRKGEKSAYQIGYQITSTYMGNGRLVTAAIDASGQLRLTVFQTLADGSIYIKGTAVAESSTKVAISQVSSSKFVTSLRDASGHLKVIGWSIDNIGQITRLGTYVGGKIYTVDQTAMGNYRVVSAVKTQSGNLKLIAFKLQFNGDIQRLGDSGNQAGAIKSANISKVAPNRMVTAVKLPDNSMKLIGWQLLLNGAVDRKESNSPTAPIYNMSMTEGGNTNGSAYVYTAVRNHLGTLQVDLWIYRYASNPQFYNFGDGHTSGISLVDTTFLPEHNYCVTATRLPSGELEVSTWETYIIE